MPTQKQLNTFSKILGLGEDGLTLDSETGDVLLSQRFPERSQASRAGEALKNIGNDNFVDIFTSEVNATYKISQGSDGAYRVSFKGDDIDKIIDLKDPEDGYYFENKIEDRIEKYSGRIQAAIKDAQTTLDSYKTEANQINEKLAEHEFNNKKNALEIAKRINVYEGAGPATLGNNVDWLAQDHVAHVSMLENGNFIVQTSADGLISSNEDRRERKNADQILNRFGKLTRELDADVNKAVRKLDSLAGIISNDVKVGRDGDVVFLEGVNTELVEALNTTNPSLISGEMKDGKVQINHEVANSLNLTVSQKAELAEAYKEGAKGEFFSEVAQKTTKLAEGTTKSAISGINKLAASAAASAAVISPLVLNTPGADNKAEEAKPAEVKQALQTAPSAMPSPLKVATPNSTQETSGAPTTAETTPDAAATSKPTVSVAKEVTKEAPSKSAKAEAAAKSVSTKQKPTQGFDLTNAANIIKSLDIGRQNDDGSITTKINGKAVSDKEIGKSELDKLTSVAQSGVIWNEKDRTAHEKQREELASALGINAKDGIDKGELARIDKAIKQSGVKLDAAELANVLEHGQLHPSTASNTATAQITQSFRR